MKQLSMIGTAQLDTEAMSAEEELHAAEDQAQLIAFSIDDQSFGVEITTVREIRAWSGATPLPNTAPFVRGVINLRGTIVPILDLRARFGYGLTSPTKTHVVVVLANGNKWIGILVDAVSDILTISKNAIHEMPDGEQEHGLVNGIVTHNDRMVSLINLPAIIADSVVH